MKAKKIDEISLLFETSWEVCNKIGGIYTVLSTASQQLQTQFGDRLIFIGPDRRDDNESANPDFRPLKTLNKKSLAKLDLPFGIKVSAGRWDIPGKPNVILIDFRGVYPELDRIFGEMWTDFGVESLHEYGDYREGCAFAVAASIVQRAIADFFKVDKTNVVTHWHEWTTGMGLLYTLKHFPEAATVFTTHAASIGRSICGNGKPLYDYFHAYNGDQMARELNLEAKHSLEKTAAKMADCFTTVSEVTAAECAQLLDIAPQVITPNGFDFDFVPKTRKFSQLREIARKKILETATEVIGKKFDADTFIVATSGRNEFRNKGIDLFIDSMQELAYTQKKSDRNILALILVPAWSSDINRRLSSESAQTEHNNFSTHHLHNEREDLIWNRLLNFSIPEDSHVSMLYVPCYLDGNDGVLNIPYYDLLPAVDATVFPSYYEPWGYTPLESVAFSIPAVTTDKAGFGQFVLSNFSNGFGMSGVFVVSRTDNNYEECRNEINTAVYSLYEMTPDHIKEIRKNAADTALNANWKLFIKYYDEAFILALKNHNKRLK